MKRERKAAPSPIQRNWIGHPAGLGCGLVLAVYLGVCLLLFTACALQVRQQRRLREAAA